MAVPRVLPDEQPCPFASLETPDANLGAGVQILHGSYARVFNDAA